MVCIFSSSNDATVQLIKSGQLPNGEWLQGNIEHVFNRTWPGKHEACHVFSIFALLTSISNMVGCPGYKFYSPLGVLGPYEHYYIPCMKEMDALQAR